MSTFKMNRYINVKYEVFQLPFTCLFALFDHKRLNGEKESNNHYLNTMYVNICEIHLLLLNTRIFSMNLEKMILLAAMA